MWLPVRFILIFAHRTMKWSTSLRVFNCSKVQEKVKCLIKSAQKKSAYLSFSNESTDYSGCKNKRKKRYCSEEYNGCSEYSVHCEWLSSPLQSVGAFVLQNWRSNRCIQVALINLSRIYPIINIAIDAKRASNTQFSRERVDSIQHCNAKNKTNEDCRCTDTRSHHILLR